MEPLQAASPAGAQGQGRTSKPPMISSALRLCVRIWAAICSRCFPGSVLNIRAEVRHVPPTPRPRPARPPSRVALSLPQRADGSGHVSKGLCERKREAASQLPQDAPASLETEAMSGAARTRAKWHGKGRPQARARPSTSRDVTPTRAGRPPTSAPRRTQPTRAIAPTAAAPTARVGPAGGGVCAMSGRTRNRGASVVRDRWSSTRVGVTSRTGPCRSPQ